MTYIHKALIVAAASTAVLAAQGTAASAMDRDPSSTNTSESRDHIRYIPTRNVTRNRIQLTANHIPTYNNNKDFLSQK